MQSGSTNTSFVLLLAAGVLIWALADSDGFGRWLARAERQLSQPVADLGTDFDRLLGDQKRHLGALWGLIRSGGAQVAEGLSQLRVRDLGDRLAGAFADAGREEPAPSEVPAPAAPPDVSAAPPAVEDFAPVDALLEQAEIQVNGAHFENALATIATARDLLEPSEDSAAARRRRARLEVLVGTAEVAFGRPDAARESFARAIEADPELRLEPSQTSPKVLHVFNTAAGATRRR